MLCDIFFPPAPLDPPPLRESAAQQATKPSVSFALPTVVDASAESASSSEDEEVMQYVDEDFEISEASMLNRLGKAKLGGEEQPEQDPTGTQGAAPADESVNEPRPYVLLQTSMRRPHRAKSQPAAGSVGQGEVGEREGPSEEYARFTSKSRLQSGASELLEDPEESESDARERRRGDAIRTALDEFEEDELESVEDFGSHITEIGNSTIVCEDLPSHVGWRAVMDQAQKLLPTLKISYVPGRVRKRRRRRRNG